MEQQMHNFEQVKDVLDYGIHLHNQLTELYDSLNQQNDQARVKMLLDYLSRHEKIAKKRCSDSKMGLARAS